MGTIGREGRSDGSYEVCSRGLVFRFVLISEQRDSSWKAVLFLSGISSDNLESSINLLILGPVHKKKFALSHFLFMVIRVKRKVNLFQISTTMFPSPHIITPMLGGEGGRRTPTPSV
jgi:hypothetical protein